MGGLPIRRGWPVLAALLLLEGCMDKLPTAPDQLETGVTIYEHANFLGDSAHVTNDASDLADFKGPCEHDSTVTVSEDYTYTSHYYDWNDCTSSVKVAPGWKATLYRDDDFKGQSLEVTSDVPNLQLVPGSCDHDGLNDCVTSIRVSKR